MARRSERMSLWWLLAAVLILMLATGLRFYRIGSQSLWYDEGNSARMVTRSPDEILVAAGRDIHPPAYYLLLAGWTAFVGDSEFGLRSLSALVGVLTVAAVYSVGQRLFERQTALLAGLITAVSSFQVYYGQEARMYALLALLSVLSIRLAAAVLTLPGEMQRGHFDRVKGAGIVIAYILVNTLGLYTHYTFPLVILAESAIFLWWMAHRSRKLHGIVIWVGLQVFTLILFAPWIPTTYHQLSSWPHLTAGAVDFATIIRTLVFGVTLPEDATRYSMIPVGILALAALLPPVQPDSRYLKYTERAGFIVVWFGASLAIFLAGHVLREPNLKFLLPLNLALILLVARGTVIGFEVGRPLPEMGLTFSIASRAVVFILVVLGCWPLFAGLNHLYFDPTYMRDDYRAIAQRIMKETGERAAIVLVAPNQQEVFTYYYPEGAGITPLPDNHTEETLNNLVQQNRRIYALFWGEAEQDPEGKVEKKLQASAFVADSTWYGNVRLVTYAIPAAVANGMETSLDAEFGQQPGIRLLGYTLSGPTVTPGDALGITLFWTTDASILKRFKVFVHIYKPDGTVLTQHDGEPGGGLSQTDAWQVGQEVVDNHGLLLPIDTPPGIYQLMVGMYEGNTRLDIIVGSKPIGDRLLIGSIEVK